MRINSYRRKREKEEKQLVKEQRVKESVSPVHQLFSKMHLSGDDDSSEDAVCPKFGLVYTDSGGLWVCCYGCNEWYDIKCIILY